MPNLYYLSILIQDRLPRRQTLGPNKTDESLDEKRVSCEPSAQGALAVAGECTGTKWKGSPGRELKLVFRMRAYSPWEHRLTGGQAGVSS